MPGGDLLLNSDGKALGTIDIGSVMISNQYEEEGSSEFDSEEGSESVSVSMEPLI